MARFILVHQIAARKKGGNRDLEYLLNTDAIVSVTAADDDGALILLRGSTKPIHVTEDLGQIREMMIAED